MTNFAFNTVILDCDSTLCTIEGIDELARRADVYDECYALTNAAMQGDIKLEDVFGKRLEKIKPLKSDLDWLGQLYVDNITDGVQELISQLQQADITIYIVSGGLRQAVLVLANKLNIKQENVYAVDVQFDEEGEYQDFDHCSPLARAGGKEEIVNQIRTSDMKIACIGDGITDLEMQNDDVFFIGFGGVEVREKVKEQANVFIEDQSIMATLPYLKQ